MGKEVEGNTLLIKGGPGRELAHEVVGRTLHRYVGTEGP